VLAIYTLAICVLAICALAIHVLAIHVLAICALAICALAIYALAINTLTPGIRLGHAPSAKSCASPPWPHRYRHRQACVARPRGPGAGAFARGHLVGSGPGPRAYQALSASSRTCAARTQPAAMRRERSERPRRRRVRRPSAVQRGRADVARPDCAGDAEPCGGSLWC
jgi:hypothetical protein